MKAFIWFLLVLYMLSVIGKAIMLARNDYQRKSSDMIGGILLELVLIVWAAWLLGNNA